MDKLEKIKPIVIKRSKEVFEFLKERKEMVTLTVLGLVLVGLFITVFIPKTKAQIRVKQTDALALKDYTNTDKVVGITYNQLEDTIINTENVVVALVDQDDPYYEEFVLALNDKQKMAEFPEKVYVYPIIYDKKKTRDFYKLESGLTLIYFQNKKEVQRINLDSQKEVELYLVDHLNSLLRPSNSEVMKLEAERLAREEAEKQAAAEKKKLEEEEVIDELKNSETTDQ